MIYGVFFFFLNIYEPIYEINKGEAYFQKLLGVLQLEINVE